MPLVNIDTDMIIPKQFLKTIKRTGLGANLFDEMRFDREGNENPEDFVLNTSRLPRRANPGGGGQFRVRVEPGTCALGLAGFRHPLCDLDQFCRHLL